MSGIYLALGQGTSRLKAAFGNAAAHRHLEHVGRFVRHMAAQEGLLAADSGFSLDAKVELRAGKGAALASDYEKGAIISRLYERGQLPAETELLGHINELLDAYSKVTASLHPPYPSCSRPSHRPPRRRPCAAHPLAACATPRAHGQRVAVRLLTRPPPPPLPSPPLPLSAWIAAAARPAARPARLRCCETTFTSRTSRSPSMPSSRPQTGG